MTTEARRPTRQLIQPDLPRFDPGDLPPDVRDALARLLLAMADDEFVIGFWDSEWTGIGPMLEEDVAFSSIAQDEIGHARIFYEMLGTLTGEQPDRIAFGRAAEDYRHAALVDHARHDWAFSIARRWLYETADAVRLDALRETSFTPLREVVAKVRREERYHLMHMDSWLRRLAEGTAEPRHRLEQAFAELAPDAASVFTPLDGEELLIEAGILGASLADLAQRWHGEAGATLERLGLPRPEARSGQDGLPAAGGRDHRPPSKAFNWLWTEFTSVARLEEGAEW